MPLEYSRAGVLAEHFELERYLRTMAVVALCSASRRTLAIRAGSQPTEPDYVVRPMGTLRHPIYAAPEYLATHGEVLRRPRGVRGLPDRDGSLEERLRLRGWLSGLSFGMRQALTLAGFLVA